MKSLLRILALLFIPIFGICVTTMFNYCTGCIDYVGSSGGGGGGGYVAPAVTLAASPSAETLELGTTLSTVTLSAFTVENSSPITSVVFLRNGSSIFSVPSPHSSGGTEVYADTSGVTATAVYTAKVSDGITTTTSNSVTFTFVYPFYYGVGAQALTGAQVQALTDLVQVKQNTTVTTSPTNQVYYFAYPQAYGSLSSIKDQNGFNVTAGYTQRSASLTMMDSTSQPYYIYEFNNLTTQVNFGNTYSF
jgi:hypothetical protein